MGHSEAFKSQSNNHQYKAKKDATIYE